MSAALILRAVHHDERGYCGHLRDHAQHFGVKVLIRGKVGSLHTQKVFHGARDVMYFPHFRRAGHCTLECLLRGFGMQVQPHGQIGHETAPRLQPVDHRAIALDDPTPFKLLHPPQAGGWRQAHLRCKVDVADPAIALQFAQYPVRNGVKIRHELQTFQLYCDIRNSDAPDTVQNCKMTLENLLALIGFAFVTSVTPGPNNMMLLASGANFGFRRTIPHMLGISIGHLVMTVIVGLGLAGIVHQEPRILVALKWVSVAYLLWLAWHLANAAAPEGKGASGRPMTFLGAAAFQWVNPKAWTMSLGAVAAYAPEATPVNVAIVAAVFAAVNLPSVSVWTVAGEQVRRFLTSPARLRAFNWTMAGLLVLSLWPVITH
jgi:threonine/homoserine/homoserine lactone efflux protein